MSKRPHRSLFESSLEMKCLCFFGVALTVVISVSIYLSWKVMWIPIKRQNPLSANLWVVQHLTNKHWAAFKPSSETETSAAASSTSTDTTESDEFIKLMEAINQRIRRQEFSCEIIPAEPPRPSPLDPNAPTPEKAAEIAARYAKGGEYDQFISKLDSPETVFFDRLASDGQYHYYEAIRAERICLSCHNLDRTSDDELAVGDLMAVAHVVVPEPPSKREITRNWALLLGVAIITAFLSIIAFYVIVRWVIIRPMKSLRDVAEAISRGDTTKRAQLTTGDEFEALGEAFNRMIQHLRSAHEKLRTTNIDLEKHVDELAHLTIQLYETNRVKSDFMATMSHELRTPLNSILGFSDVLGGISTLNEKQQRYVENINKSGRSLLTMINDILDMAKMEAGRMEPHISTFSIEQIAAAQCDMAKPLVDKKNIDLSLTLEPSLPPMEQDASRIQQILNNLLSNAIKFTPEGGRISVVVNRVMLPPRAAAGNVPIPTRAAEVPVLKLVVTDTGVGISPEDQLVVFEKFRQGSGDGKSSDTTLRREHSGSGLGLSIVKEICKMLDGEVTLESRLGVGSTFVVHLPWTLSPKIPQESEMMTEISKFAKGRNHGTPTP
ncbi:MAG: sensor histidine kinase [Thermoguttaceae bacterium]